MKKRLPAIDFTRQCWRWHGLAPETAEFLRRNGTPDRFEWVKLNTGRAVARLDGYFLKFDWSPRIKARLFPAARQEYRTALRLQTAGIATVEHLGWGRMRGMRVLVTRAWREKSVCVYDYWYENFVYGDANPAEFLGHFAEYLHMLLRQPLQHRDFHLGNILYSPSDGAFALVDLHHVKLGSVPDMHNKLLLLHVISELRAAAVPGTMLKLFWDTVGLEPDGAGQQLQKMLTADLARLKHQWPRRVKQFLSGYPKFSDFVNYDNQTLLVRRNMLRQPLFDPEAARSGAYRVVRLEFQAALEQLLFSFWLAQLLIPHVPVVALAPDGTLYFQRPAPADQLPRTRDKVNDFNEYLLCFELNLEDYSAWRERPGGGVIIADFTAMLASSPYRELFRPRHVRPDRWRA